MGSGQIITIFTETPNQKWLHKYRTQVYLGSDLRVRVSLTEWVQDLCADLTDVTLADEDTNSILSDNANGHSNLWDIHKLVDRMEDWSSNGSGWEMKAASLDTDLCQILILCVLHLLYHAFSIGTTINISGLLF